MDSYRYSSSTKLLQEQEQQLEWTHKTVTSIYGSLFSVCLHCILHASVSGQRWSGKDGKGKLYKKKTVYEALAATAASVAVNANYNLLVLLEWCRQMVVAIVQQQQPTNCI